MLTKTCKLELTMRKVRMSERSNGTPEECWIAKYEHQEQGEAQDEAEIDEDRSGVA
jgi:hypothetical protein